MATRPLSIGPIWVLAVGVGAALYALYSSNKRKNDNTEGDDDPVVARIDELIVYPIKSASGVRVDECELTWKGLKYDRSYSIVVPVVEESDQSPSPHTAQYRALSQAKTPRMSLIHPALPNAQGITISFVESGEKPSSIHVPLLMNGRRITIVLWGNTAVGIDQGDEAAQWLSEHLDIPGTRLLKAVDEEELTRYLAAAQNCPDAHHLDYHYIRPLDILSRASVAQVVAHVPVEVGRRMDHRRFRANIILDGCSPFTEDKYSTLEFQDNSSLKIDLDRLCDRCVIPSVDPDTGIKDTETKEPFPTLLSYRRGKTIMNSCHPRHRRFLAEHSKLPFLGVHATPRFAEGASSRQVVRVGDVVRFV